MAHRKCLHSDIHSSVDASTNQLRMSDAGDTAHRDLLIKALSNYIQSSADSAWALIHRWDALVVENQQQAYDIDSLHLSLEAEKHTHRKDNEYLLEQNQQLRDALELITTLPSTKASIVETPNIARAALDGTEDGPPRAENREAVQPTKGTGSS